MRMVDPPVILLLCEDIGSSISGWRRGVQIGLSRPDSIASRRTLGKLAERKTDHSGRDVNYATDPDSGREPRRRVSRVREKAIRRLILI
jgi:hypothetical protein